MAKKSIAEEYRGRLVRVRWDITTTGGTRFPAGSVCRVDYVDSRGKLSLSMRNPDPLNIFGPQRIQVIKVRLHQVELLPPRKK